jgi:hypothetical protein
MGHVHYTTTPFCKTADVWDTCITLLLHFVKLQMYGTRALHYYYIL